MKISKFCIGQKCWCGAPAVQKIEQILFEDMSAVHPYTTYVCQHHFDRLMHGEVVMYKLEQLQELLERRRIVGGMGTPIQMVKDIMTLLRE